MVVVGLGETWLACGVSHQKWAPLSYNWAVSEAWHKPGCASEGAGGYRMGRSPQLPVTEELKALGGSGASAFSPQAFS